MAQPPFVERRRRACEKCGIIPTKKKANRAMLMTIVLIWIFAGLFLQLTYLSYKDAGRVIQQVNENYIGQSQITEASEKTLHQLEIYQENMQKRGFYGLIITVGAAILISVGVFERARRI